MAAATSLGQEAVPAKTNALERKVSLLMMFWSKWAVNESGREVCQISLSNIISFNWNPSVTHKSIGPGCLSDIRKPCTPQAQSRKRLNSTKCHQKLHIKHVYTLHESLQAHTGCDTSCLEGENRIFNDDAGEVSRGQHGIIIITIIAGPFLHFWP